MANALRILTQPKLTGEQGQGHQLSVRETELLRLIANGQSMKAAAHMMGVSYKTADTYAQKIRWKTGTHNAVEMTRYAIRTGLVKA